MRSLLIAVLLLFSSHLAFGLPVFPGAAGYGSHTLAGRGGEVYRVTNLNDDGPGSLRHGVEQVQGPRVIVFEVSGVIELKSDLVVRPASEGKFGFLTIAGQTAPPPGITLKNAGISVQAHEVLIQHLAIRPGPTARGAAIKVNPPANQTVHNVVFDHVSCGWANGETVSVWADQDASIEEVTFSDCIFSETLADRPPGFGFVGARNTLWLSVLRNVMAFNPSGNPFFRDTFIMVETVNNLIHWPGHEADAAIHVGPDNPELVDMQFILSFAGNVIHRRPLGKMGGREVSTTAVYLDDNATSLLSLYLANNWVHNPDTGTWHPTDKQGFSPEVYREGKLKPGRWTSNPFPATESSPSTESPDVLEARLLARAGKQPAFRDALDTNLIEKIRSREEGTVRASDLKADAWKPVDVRRTRVLELPENPNADEDNDGYTRLEEWLHGWAAYVEGRADQPPSATNPEGAATYHQTPGVVSGLPVFFQDLKDRATHGMSWTTGKYKDFEAWKALARERVRASWLTPPPVVPWEVTMLGEQDRGTYVARKFVFNLTGDSRVLAYMTVPKGKGPFPAVLLLHDHGGHFDVGKEKVIRPFDVPQTTLDKADSWVKRALSGRFLGDELAKRGYVCFATDMINWGDRGGGGSKGQEVLASNLMHLGMSFAGVIAWEDMRAAEFLAQQPEVDPGRIASMGISVGGYRAWQVTAMSDHIAAGVSVCWIGTIKSMMFPGHHQTSGSPAYSMLHPGLLADLDYPDIASIAAPKPMLFYNGRFDRLFPQHGIEEAYAKMRAVWESQNAGDKLHTQTWPVVHRYYDYMQEEAFDWLDRVMPPKDKTAK